MDRENAHEIEQRTKFTPLRDMLMEPVPHDPGAHYRKELKVNITKDDLERGYVVVKLDPARIARVYTGLTAMLFTILKKTLRCGTGGKTYVEDLHDIISAAEREIEILKEDGEIE